jgi:GNAT superfamily N-acetyltransferase
MKLEIRAAKREEVSDILFFIRELAEYEKLSHEVEATEERLRDSLFGESRNAEVVFAIKEGRKVGFALFFKSYSTFLGKDGIYLEDLFVLKEFRGQGYGKSLLGHLANEVIRRDFGRLEWSVLDWNKPSIEFYESLGAKKMEGWSTYRLVGEELSELACYR